MADIEIVCANRDSKHRRIVAVGLRRLHAKRAPFVFPVHTAIALRDQGHKLWVDRGGGRVVAVDEMETHTGTFLRTHPNGIVADNLVNLPTCPPELTAQSTGNSLDDVIAQMLSGS
jgi:hypothetical protein